MNKLKKIFDDLLFGIDICRLTIFVIISSVIYIIFKTICILLFFILKISIVVGLFIYFLIVCYFTVKFPEIFAVIALMLCLYLGFKPILCSNKDNNFLNQ